MAFQTSMTRRNVVALGAGAALVAGAAAVEAAQAEVPAPAEDAPTGDGDPTVGTRYTKAANPDEIGIIHDAQATEQADVVVVGGGMAGLVCAMITAEQAPDAKVILVEAQGQCGGGANFAEQADMPAPGTDLQTALQEANQEAIESHFVKDGRMIAEVKYEMGRNSAWMFGKHAVPLYIRHMDRLKSAIDAGDDIKIQPIACYDGGNGSKTIQGFVDLIGSDAAYANVEIRTETRGTALLVEEEGADAVEGVQVKNADGTYTSIECKAVVLAGGGMSNNLELLQNYSNQDLSHCVSVDQHHYGDPMVMAEQTSHGRCKTIALSSMLAYVDGFHYQSWLELAAGNQPSALFVNQDGVRFTTENMGFSQIDLSKIVEGQGATFSIMGQNLYNYYKDNGLFVGVGFYGDGQDERPYDLDADLEEYKDNPNLFIADTIEELAEKMGVPADALADTVERYDADAEAGQGDTVFLKEAEYMIPLGDAPYYGFKLSSLIVNTNAGIRCNEKCQVIDQAHVPVKGLYAAGIDVSGFLTDIYEVGHCQCISIWSGSKAARTLVETELGGTVADDWFGDAEWGPKDLPNFSNWDEYEAWAAEQPAGDAGDGDAAEQPADDAGQAGAANSSEGDAPAADRDAPKADDGGTPADPAAK